MLLLLCCALVACLAAQCAALPTELRCLYAEGVPQLCRVERFALLPGQVRLATARACNLLMSVKLEGVCCSRARRLLCETAWALEILCEFESLGFPVSPGVRLKSLS